MKEHRVIVAGSRTFNDYKKLDYILFEYAERLGPDIGMSVVSGAAKGADRLGYDWAKNNGAQVYVFRPDWNTYGKRAGFLRNEEMGNFSDALIAFWDGQSHGTKHMIDYMYKLNKEVTVIAF